MKLNQSAVSFLEERIAAGYFRTAIDLDLAPEERQELVESGDWPRITLGIDEAQPDDSAERYTHPVAKRVDGELMVYKNALNDAEVSAASNDETEMLAAAQSLGDQIAKVASGEVEPTPSEDGGVDLPSGGDKDPDIGEEGGQQPQGMSSPIDNTRTFYRSARIVRAKVNENDRTAEVAFSSEEPVRRFFGWEVLDHSPDAIDLRRMQDGAAVLVEHDPDRHVGIVEEAWIGPDRRGRARIRFGRSEYAEAVFRDVLDGIKTKTSVGYVIHRDKLDGTRDGLDVYRATSWEPLEITLTAIPADATVGVGRSHERDGNTTKSSAARAARKEPDVNRKFSVAAPVRHYDPDDTGTPTVDHSAELEEIRKAERNRANRIRTIAQQVSPVVGIDLTADADKAIEDGIESAEFESRVLDKIGDQKPTQKQISDPHNATRDIGLSNREVQDFSIVKLARLLCDPGSRALREDAAFEIEVSDATAKRTGRDPKEGFFVPVQVQAGPTGLQSGRRDLDVESTGADWVGTALQPQSFIDVLRAMSAVMPMATILRDLTQNIAIPKASAGSTGGWINTEGGTPANSEPTLEQVGLVAHTVGAYFDMTRRMMIQGTPDIEAFARRDLAIAIALAIDLAAINGSGSSGVPEGILQKSGIGAASGSSKWAKVVSLETAVGTANAAVDGMMYLTNPTGRGHLKSTEKASGTARFIWSDGNEINGYPGRVSTQVPSDLGAGSDESALIFGNFRDVVIGMFGPMELTLDPYTQNNGNTKRIRVLQEADVAVRNEESFAADTDVTDVT